MKGLFTDNEMVSDNVKEKDSKLAFLQKVIDMVCKYQKWDRYGLYQECGLDVITLNVYDSDSLLIKYILS